MLPALWRRFEHGVRQYLPLITTALLTLASVIAWPIPYLGPVSPCFGFIAVYYWVVHRPDLFRSSAAFGIGVLNDAINFFPLGLSSVINISVRELLLRQRRSFVGQSFIMLWFGFALIMPFTMTVHWCLLALLRWQWIPVFPVFLQSMLTIVLFPLPTWLLIRVQRAALSQG